MAVNVTTPADWYADPADPTLHRWWDGTGWTDRLRPAVPLRTVGSTRRARSTIAEHPEPRELPGAGLAAVGTIELPPGGYRARVAREEIVAPRPATPASNNRVATVAVLLGIIVTVGFAVAQFYELPLTFLFAPSLVALATAALAFNRARQTGAAIASSTIALVVAVPLPAISIWAFAVELSGLVS